MPTRDSTASRPGNPSGPFPNSSSHCSQSHTAAHSGQQSHQPSAAIDTVHGLSERCQKAPKHGVNGKYLIIQAARLVAQQERAANISSPGGPDTSSQNVQQQQRQPPPLPKQVQPHAQLQQPPHKQPQKQQQQTQQQRSTPIGPTPLTAMQALALVPNASRPFVPFRARAFCTQQQRQQVANRLLGAYLVLLLQELAVDAGRQAQVVKDQPAVAKAAAAAALAHEAAVYMAVTNAKAYQSQSAAAAATLQHVPQDQLQQLRVLLPPPAAPPAAAAAAAAAAKAEGQSTPACNGKRSRQVDELPGAKRQHSTAAGAAGSLTLPEAARVLGPSQAQDADLDALLHDLFEDDALGNGVGAAQQHAAGTRPAQQQLLQQQQQPRQQQASSRTRQGPSLTLQRDTTAQQAKQQQQQQKGTAGGQLQAAGLVGVSAAAAPSAPGAACAAAAARAEASVAAEGSAGAVHNGQNGVVAPQMKHRDSQQQALSSPSKHAVQQSTSSVEQQLLQEPLALQQQCQTARNMRQQQEHTREPEQQQPPGTSSQGQVLMTQQQATTMQQQQQPQAADSSDSEDEAEREARELAALRQARRAAAAAAAAAGYVYSPTSSPNRMDEFLEAAVQEHCSSLAAPQQLQQELPQQPGPPLAENQDGMHGPPPQQQAAAAAQQDGGSNSLQDILQQEAGLQQEAVPMVEQGACVLNPHSAAEVQQAAAPATAGTTGPEDSPAGPCAEGSIAAAAQPAAAGPAGAAAAGGDAVPSRLAAAAEQQSCSGGPRSSQATGSTPARLQVAAAAVDEASSQGHAADAGAVPAGAAAAGLGQSVCDQLDRQLEVMPAAEELPDAAEATAAAAAAAAAAGAGSVAGQHLGHAAAGELHQASGPVVQQGAAGAAEAAPQVQAATAAVPDADGESLTACDGADSTCAVQRSPALPALLVASRTEDMFTPHSGEPAALQADLCTGNAGQDCITAEIVAAAAVTHDLGAYVLSEAACGSPATDREPRPLATDTEERHAGLQQQDLQGQLGAAGDGADAAWPQLLPEHEDAAAAAAAAAADAGYVPSDDPVDDTEPTLAAPVEDLDADAAPYDAQESDAVSVGQPVQHCSQLQQQVEEGEGEGGSSGDPPALPSVEAQVAAFVASVLEPLMHAGVVGCGLAEKVVGKAIEKIMRKHEGSTDGSFLVHEYTSITKLVTALVDHYQKRGIS